MKLDDIIPSLLPQERKFIDKLDAELDKVETSVLFSPPSRSFFLPPTEFTSFLNQVLLCSRNGDERTSPDSQAADGRIG